MIARFQDTWRKHKSHGMWADGSGGANGTTYGAWLVHNTVETYFGGPLHSDLVVDGIVYNYISSNHHGDRAFLKCPHTNSSSPACRPFRTNNHLAYPLVYSLASTPTTSMIQTARFHTALVTI